MISPDSLIRINDNDPTTWPQTIPGNFWVPGWHLDREYPIPSGDDLVELWKTHMETTEAIQAHDVFGVFTPPIRDIEAVASIDLCEVVRHTRKALYEITGVKDGHNSNYSIGTWYDPSKVGVAYERSIVVSVIRAAINTGQVSSVEGMDSISEILKEWRNSGVLVIANTSTLPGCEPGTIEHTLANSARKQFDGIVFPRNHDGNGSTSKANAIRTLMQEAKVRPDVPVIHIDDADYHHKAFRDEKEFFCGLMFLLAPTYDGVQVPNADATFESPLKAFTGATNLLKHMGVVR